MKKLTAVEFADLYPNKEEFLAMISEKENRKPYGLTRNQIAEELNVTPYVLRRVIEKARGEKQKQGRPKREIKFKEEI